MLNKNFFSLFLNSITKQVVMREIEIFFPLIFWVDNEKNVFLFSFIHFFLYKWLYEWIDRMFERIIYLLTYRKGNCFITCFMIVNRMCGQWLWIFGFVKEFVEINYLGKKFWFEFYRIFAKTYVRFKYFF